MCFVSFGSEVFTHDLIKNWIRLGKKVSVPYIEKLSNGKRLMHAVRLGDFSDLRKNGSFGILEPEFHMDNIVRPEKLDLVIVPGSAFDLNKNRMGYGGGFYDSFLPGTLPDCKKIAVCFDFQVLDSIPHEDCDIPVDLIVTEKRII